MTRAVTVVGASSAGLYAAYLLACGRLPVQVLEGADQFDPSPRTLIVTSRMRDLLGRLGDQAVVNQIRRFELFTDGRVATVPLQRADLVIERSILIRHLAERAEAAGARIFLGRRFRRLEPKGNGLTVTVERQSGRGEEEFCTRTVIGADGASSKVAQAAGWPKQPTVSLLQAAVRLPRDLPLDTTRVWFIPEDSPYFYWLIPESPVRGVLGLIGEDSQQTRPCLERFLERHGFDPLEFQGARIPLYTRWVPVHRQIGDGHVYLVGDAAGHVKVTTVGGVVTGFWGAMAVAEAVLNGGTSRELSALRRELTLHLLIRRTLHRFAQKDYSRLVDLLHMPAQRSLGRYTRDEAGRLLWHLCLRQPRLLLLGIRSLLTAGRFPTQPRLGWCDLRAN